MKNFLRGGRFAKKDYGRSRSSGFPGNFHRVRARAEAESETGRKFYRATCSVCGATCQVPFRPDGSRPIYCRNCYRPEEGRANKGAHHPPAESLNLVKDLARRLESIERKLDMILESLGTGTEDRS